MAIQTPNSNPGQISLFIASNIVRSCFSQKTLSLFTFISPETPTAPEKIEKANQANRYSFIVVGIMIGLIALAFVIGFINS